MTVKLKRITLASIILLICSFIISGCTDKSGDTIATEFDLVINGGTVIDPASGTNKKINVGIKDGTVVTLSENTLQGAQVIDARGKTISPGFIDLHTHSPFPFGEELQARDGVTTSLDLEAGAFPAADYGSYLHEGAFANYGSSVGYYAIRMKVIEGKVQPYVVTDEGAMVPGAAFSQLANTQQIEEMRKLLHQGIDLGGIGIGFLLDYMSPAISDDELNMIFSVAKERNVAVWAHIRRGVNGDIQPLHDVLDVAKETGAKLHICHINANAMGEIGNWLKTIDTANANGADVSVEMFPYTAGSTSISGDVFNRDWQTIFGIKYEDVQWAETGEFFTKETWEDKRKNRPDGMVIHHYMNEDWLKIGMQHPQMMIASDAMPALNSEQKSAPNGAGTYTRLLARYVRDLKVLSIEEAIAKGSYYPARRLESFAPAFKKKGRIQEGADADILVFDINNLQDNATYTDPYQQSTGWSYIIIDGKVIFDHGKATGLKVGRLILAN